MQPMHCIIKLLSMHDVVLRILGTCVFSCPLLHAGHLLQHGLCADAASFNIRAVQFGRSWPICQRSQSCGAAIHVRICHRVTTKSLLTTLRTCSVQLASKHVLTRSLAVQAASLYAGLRRKVKPVPSALTARYKICLAFCKASLWLLET